MWRPVASAASLVAAGALGLGVVVSPLPAQAVVGVCSGSPQVTVVQPGANVPAELGKLCPGDTLQLAPGTYVTGYMRLYLGGAGIGGIRAGTPSAPITVTSQDPSQPALIQGGLQLYSPHYWRVTNLRIQATVAGQPALTIRNGIGWSVRSCEFWGARQTNAYGNVVISGGGGQPSRFEFRSNLVHDAARSTRSDATDHNIYVNFQGAPGSGGIITRNVIWNAPHGAGIKLGAGGAYNSPGPWGVLVSMNTFYNSGRQILLHGNVRNNTVYGNLFVLATQRFVSNPQTTQIYIHDVTGTGNYIHHNFAFASTMFSYDPTHRVVYGRGNPLSNTVAANPRLSTVNGRPLVATNPLEAPYGAYGTMRWPA